MTIRVAVALRAERDAQRIYEWLAGQSPTGAYSWFDEYLKAVDSLQVFPLRGAITDEGTSYGRTLRQIFFRTRAGRTYRLLYIVTNDLVTVLHVRGPGQRPVNDPD